MVYWGFIRPTRDFAVALHTLQQQGLVARLGEPSPLPVRQSLDDMERTVARIRALLS